MSEWTQPNTPKYLVVCDGGNVRSHAVAFHLKWHLHREAIAVGRIHVSKATMTMLSKWADKIVLMQPHMIESIPKRYHDKCLAADVGEDKWGVGIHPELNQLAKNVTDWLMMMEGGGTLVDPNWPTEPPPAPKNIFEERIH